MLMNGLSALISCKINRGRPGESHSQHPVHIHTHRNRNVLAHTHKRKLLVLTKRGKTCSVTCHDEGTLLINTANQSRLIKTPEIHFDKTLVLLILLSPYSPFLSLPALVYSCFSHSSSSISLQLRDMRSAGSGSILCLDLHA